VDRLRIAYFGPVNVASILASGGVNVGRERYHVDARKAQGRALGLNGQGIEVAASERITIVDLRALFLATHTPADAVATAARVAGALRSPGERIERAEVWGLDLCADIAGARFGAGDVGAFLSRLRRSDAWHTSARRTAGDPVVTGLSIGSKKAILVTIYNKSAELRGKRAEVAAMERARWEARGWDGTGDVWRVEFKLRGHPLSEYGLRDPAALVDRIDPAWQALATKVVRLVDLGSATRRERCEVDPRWQPLHGATFVHGCARPAARNRASEGGPATAAIVGSVASWLARRGVSQAEARALLEAVLAAGGTSAELADLPGQMDRAWARARVQGRSRVGPGPRQARTTGARNRAA
jgi:hypothetical protein